jgi:hypothetical protein
MIRTGTFALEAQLPLPLNQRVRGNNLLNSNALPDMSWID